MAPGAGLMFAKEAEVALRTALIGISASALIMGCFPGTKLPCLKNVWLQSKRASALGQSLPGVCSGRQRRPGALPAPVVQGAPRKSHSQGRGGHSPAKQSICFWLNRNCVQDLEGRLFPCCVQ